jgi:hypothetical protein
MVAPAVLAAARDAEFNPSAIMAALQEPYYLHRTRLKDMDADVADLRGRLHAWLGWYADACHPRHIRPWLLYFPYPPQTSDRPSGPLRDECYVAESPVPRVVGECSVARALERSCAEFDIKFIDATDVLTSKADEPLYLRFDGHPNAAGYEVVGQLVSQHMRRQFSDWPARMATLAPSLDSPRSTASP